MPGIIVIPVDRPDDPCVAEFSNLKDAELRRQEFHGERNTFIAESELTVRQLLQSSCAVVSVLLTRDVLQGLRPAIEAAAIARGADITVYVVTPPLMERIAGFAFHRGVLACGVRPPESDIADILAHSSSLTILEGISNHDNIGSIFRNVGALGGPRPGILLGPGCCDPYYRKSIRVSIGHVLDIPFAHLPEWPSSLKAVKQAGWTVIALSPSSDAVALPELMSVRPRRPALLLGAEGPGLSRRAEGEADLLVRIPMRRGVDSLNVAVAGAVAMSHLSGGTG